MSTEQNIEREVGMNDRFDVGLYQVYKQAPGESMKYSGYKVWTRYRFSERGVLPLDPLLYFEYKGKPDFHEHEFEWKLILAKTTRAFTFALNPVLEFELEDGEWESIAKYNAGLVYHLPHYWVSAWRRGVASWVTTSGR